MAIVLADDPPHLFQIGRSPDPLAWPPLAFTSLGRVVPKPFFDRMIAEFQVVHGQRWLDLRIPDSIPICSR